MQSPRDRRQCPTRDDGADPLIAHMITSTTCRKRQKRFYHKCFSCVYGNVALGNGTPLADIIAAMEKAPPTVKPVLPREAVEQPPALLPARAHQVS